MVGMSGSPPHPVVAVLLAACVAWLALAQAVGADAGRSVPRLAAAPAAVRPGAVLRLTGSGFPRHVRVVLLAGPREALATRIGSAVTGARGDFVAAVRVRPRSAPGRFVAVACEAGCRLRASARFRIVRP